MTNGRRLVLSIIMISVLLIGPTLGIVRAAYLPYAHVTHTQSFDRAENNHTYVYVGDNQNNWYMNRFLNHEEDISYDYYSYGRTSWFDSSGSYDGPADRSFDWSAGDSASWGWYCDSQLLPRFYDFTTEHSDSYIGATQFYEVFPLPLNVENTLLIQPGYIYLGTFNVTDEEFFHMTVTSHQDDLEMGWLILDYEYRGIAEWGLDNGDIEVTAFPSMGNGTYYVLFSMGSGDQAQVPIDILIEPVVPETIGFGEIVEGNLPGSEYKITEDGSWIYEEMRPNVHTYKFSTNSTEYGCLTFGMNYPGGMMYSYDSFAWITSNIWYDSSMDYAWGYDPSMPSDVFYYTSFGNETYYITVQGMDNIDYYIMNELANIPELPVNEEFFIQNWQSIDWYQKPYLLNLGQDSVLRLNRTEWSSGFDWQFWTFKDNGLVDTLSIGEAGTFETASTIYLPAGEYLVTARAQSTAASGLYEFNIGPVIEGVGNVNVDNGRLVGMRVPVETMSFYRSNITLLNHENLSVLVDVDFINECGLNEYATLASIGNQQSGTSWVAYGVNTTSWELGLYTSSYTQFCEGNLIIVVAPHAMANNTGGGSIPYYQRSADFRVTFDEDADRILTDEQSVNVGDELVWANFTLDATGENDELYVVRMSVATGVWMNLSIYGEDMDDLDIYLYQNMDGCPIYLPWTDLDDTLTGTITTEASIQFGSASSEILIVFDVDRTLSDEGRLDIGIQTFMTNSFEWLPIPDYYHYGTVPGPAPAPFDPVLAVGAVAV
ncbi:MAG: hypothetical protein ACFFED_12710, partial [Candidatus Thorarchaeota archaeon]